MKKLSISEFADYCNSCSANYFIFDSLSNRNPNPLHFSRVTIQFSTKILYSLSPNRICFLNESSKMVLECVKEIRMDIYKPEVGTYFDIICGGERENEVFKFLLR